MSSAASKSADTSWLLANGPRELELLFRTVVFNASAPVLIADDDGNSKDASLGAGKLLRKSRNEIIGRPLDDFAISPSNGHLSPLRTELKEQGRQEGTLSLPGP